jgi:nucleotide-binding universal stress UspA family protein
MPYKDLLVQLDNSEQSRNRLDYAIAVAEKHGAHLTGLYALDPSAALSALAYSYPGRLDHFESYTKERDAELAQSKDTEAAFRESLRRAGVEGEWRFSESLPSETVTLHARYADLTIVGQIDPRHQPAVNAARIPEEVLLYSGRPVLIVPYIGHYKTVGETVLVAWTPTREAARTLFDAMPFLEAARKVIVLTVNPERAAEYEPGIPTADIALHLARHGVRVEAATTVASDITTGDALLNYIADSSVDMLVIGGYGHSRAKELMLGGVTRQILQQMTVPVFMSH